MVGWGTPFFPPRSPLLWGGLPIEERVSSRPGKIYADPSKSPKQVFLNVFAIKGPLLGSDHDQTQKMGMTKILL